MSKEIAFSRGRGIAPRESLFVIGFVCRVHDEQCNPVCFPVNLPMTPVVPCSPDVWHIKCPYA